MRGTFKDPLVLACCVGAGAIVAGFWLIRGASAPAWGAFLLAWVAGALAYRFHVRGRTAVADAQLQHRRASEIALATVEALARAIEARARSSRTDIRREQAYAVEMAKAFGMPAQEVEGVRMAALLHDVGKLGVPDHILTKKGPLTPEETGKVRVHSQLGADIIADVPFPYPVASLVLCHHERWDGSGYPAGISGSDIPLGARILSVVDHFVSLISDRPFRKAVSRAHAIEALWREAGDALDPVLVARFVELLPSLEAAFATGARPGMRLHATGATGEHPRHAGVSASGASVFDEIALAHKEIYALYEVAQGLGNSLGVADSMGVITEKLRELVPFASCALFLHDTIGGVARCRYAIGTGAKQLRQMELRVGSGLIGRVIVTRECRVNEDPGDDFLSIGVPADGQVLKSALVCPLIVAERVIGALAMYHTEPEFFTEDHHRLAMRVSAQASAVLHNSVLFERTHEEAVTDQLTGLPNNRFLILHLTRELARARRLASSVAVLLLDLTTSRTSTTTTGIRPVTARCAKWRRSCAAPSVRTTSSPDAAATSSSCCCRTAASRTPRPNASNFSRRSTRCRLSCAARSGCDWPPASARPCFRGMATRTRRCWPWRISRCTGTRASASASPRPHPASQPRATPSPSLTWTCGGRRRECCSGILPPVCSRHRQGHTVVGAGPARPGHVEVSIQGRSGRDTRPLLCRGQGLFDCLLPGPGATKTRNRVSHRDETGRALRPAAGGTHGWQRRLTHRPIRHIRAA